MNSFLKKINAKFTKYEILEELNINGVTYRVVDKRNPLRPLRNERALLFKKEGDSRVWIHSKIYTQSKKAQQPYKTHYQRLFVCWNRFFPIKKALMLGCAGCALPRFIARQFPDCKTTGIEYEKEFVRLANEYFFVQDIKDRFTLLEGDAFAFVEKGELKERQSLIMIDMFEEDRYPEKVYTDTFIKAIFENMDETAIAIFNFITVEKSVVTEFANSIKEPFDEKLVMKRGNENVLLLIKATDKNKLQEFVEQIKRV